MSTYFHHTDEYNYTNTDNTDNTDEDDEYEEEDNTEFYDLNNLSIELCSRNAVRFSNREEFFAYVCEKSIYDNEYYHFYFEPTNAPTGTKCHLTFRSLDRLFEYVQKYHSFYFM